MCYFCVVIINNDLFVKSDLIGRQVLVFDSCVMCGEQEDIVNHWFFSCPIARALGLLHCIVFEWTYYYQYIYIKPNSEAPTIFHISTIKKKKTRKPNQKKKKK